MKRKRKFGVSVLFLIYLALLVWIILFKLQFNINDLDTVRKINIIPFYYDKEIGVDFHIKEVLENLEIRLLDHLIISENGHFSFLENGIL